MLFGPLGRQVEEPCDAQAARKPTIHRRFDKARREESKRDRHIDPAETAPLTFSDFFRGDRSVNRKLIEPSAAARD